MVAIPSGVTMLGTGCFQNMELIESIYFADGIIKIGDNAFQGCTRLKYVVLPSTLEHIGNAAFKGTGIEEIRIPSAVSFIGRDAFMECSQLQKVELPLGRRLNYERTFKQCTALSDVQCDMGDFWRMKTGNPLKIIWLRYH